MRTYRHLLLSALHLPPPRTDKGLTLLFFARKGTNRGVSEASVANVRRACEANGVTFAVFLSSDFGKGTLRETLQVFAGKL